MSKPKFKRNKSCQCPLCGTTISNAKWDDIHQAYCVMCHEVWAFDKKYVRRLFHSPVGQYGVLFVVYTVELWVIRNSEDGSHFRMVMWEPFSRNDSKKEFGTLPIPKNCPHLCEYIDDHLQTNALRVEIIEPQKERCRLKQPEHLKQHDPTGALWIYSGGSLLHFGQCSYPDCPHDHLQTWRSSTWCLSLMQWRSRQTLSHTSIVFLSWM